MDSSFAIAVAIGLAVAGVIGGIAYVIFKKKFEGQGVAVKAEAERVLTDARKAAEAKLREASIEAKESVLAARAEFEETVDRKLAAQERREEEYSRKEQAVVASQRKIEEAKAEADRLVEEQKKRLEQISGLTAVDAKRDLVRSIENEARVEAAGLIRRIEEEAVEQATQKARHTI